MMRDVGAEAGQYVDVGDTRLWVVVRGAASAPPVLVLHGGPGLDHHMFADYLDGLSDRYRLILVDQRAQGRSHPTPPETWTLEQQAADIDALAAGLSLERYAVLGHAHGAWIALIHAIESPGAAAATILSSGLPSVRYLSVVAESLARFEPEELRAQVADSWGREANATSAQDFAYIWKEQLPYHFADPRDPRIAEYARKSARVVYSADVLQYAARGQYGGIEVEASLGRITDPVLVLAGRHDRGGALDAGESMARRIPKAELVIFENSARMTFVEDNEAYVAAVRAFLDRTIG